MQHAFVAHMDTRASLVLRELLQRSKDEVKHMSQTVRDEMHSACSHVPPPSVPVPSPPCLTARTARLHSDAPPCAEVETVIRKEIGMVFGRFEAAEEFLQFNEFIQCVAAGRRGAHRRGRSPWALTKAPSCSSQRLPAAGDTDGSGGYRLQVQHYSECLLSMFMLHNEVRGRRARPGAAGTV